MEPVDVNIGLSAYANARRYYEVKKISAVKEVKTVQANTMALQSAERKIRKELQEVKAPTPAITKIRKPFWFEKFQWFLSSENYLVIGGRDAQQNEYLVKRHLRKGDAYVHADIAGSRCALWCV
jgi:predicted ribosome quality control (RQC) complex YloA/Tae2 family protein